MIKSSGLLSAIERFIGKEQHTGIAVTVFHSPFEPHACGENRSEAAIFFGDVDSDHAAAVVGRQITRRATQPEPMSKSPTVRLPEGPLEQTAKRAIGAVKLQLLPLAAALSRRGTLKAVQSVGST